jgi:dolichol-phosphate mannosyltransferase
MRSGLSSDVYPDVSVVVPAHNEEKGIAALVGQLYGHVPDAEIIVVDDHSTDGTAAAVNALQKNYKRLILLQNEGPRGKATALLQGFHAARGGIICMIDADLQYPPAAIPDMIRWIRDGTADVVVANRSFKDPDPLRRLLSLGYTRFFGHFLLRIPVADIQAGEKAFRREVLDGMEIKARKWGFDIEFLYKARKAGRRIAELPVVFSERRGGVTKINILCTMVDLAATALRILILGN